MMAGPSTGESTSRKLAEKIKNNITRNDCIGDLARIKSIKPSACQNARAPKMTLTIPLLKMGTRKPGATMYHIKYQTHGIEQSPTATAMRPFLQQEDKPFLRIKSTASQSATPKMDRITDQKNQKGRDRDCRFPNFSLI